MAPKSFFLTLLSTLTLSLAASIPETDYEVIVIGGGPSGLSAISSLSRVRRRTILFDSGEYRNAPTREMHDVIGNDGTPPAEFRGLAREQILKYDTATIVNTTITTVTPESDPATNTTYFRAQDVDGNAYTARKVVLGTGLIDVLPAVPGLQEAWGKGVYWCPWCDGYEHRDQALGILGALPDVVGSVLETHTLNTDVIALVNGTDTPAYEAALAAKYPDWRAQLAAWDVAVDNRSIASIERLQDGEEVRGQDGSMQDVFRVWFADGDSVVRNALITNYPTAQRSEIPAQLGLKMDDGKIDTADYSGMRTSLPGVFAVGDANNDGSTNVPHAMFSGKRAGVFLHVEMAREESAAAIGKREAAAGLSRREMEKETARMVGDEMERLWKRVLESRKNAS
ncbi:sulphydryl oxidase [Aspergillus uvarum CBS 121591]|uniref:Sulphydryl oxidase n=1 Tax=Aspergillus uvarum CBS 121591 TaxID=1448315 RepID=A0A319C339_9EURO|nr:sulphydryl oxidase [Aspergillus uvarum CBS 121591]PYH78527.1 sulphydryl oxidase [Aspergillus uvarum CBS 121591]